MKFDINLKLELEKNKDKLALASSFSIWDPYLAGFPPEQGEEGSVSGTRNHRQELTWGGKL